MPGPALPLDERIQIEIGCARGESARAVAHRLDREPSTITREIARNGGRHAYGAGRAHVHAHKQRARPKPTRFQTDPTLARHVEDRLAALDSPMTIAVELARGVYPGLDTTVSHETIYRAVYAHGRAGLRAGLHRHLHRRRRARRTRHAQGEPPEGTGPLGEFTLITDRPANADSRDEVGHYEGDLIIGARNASAVITIFDRASRRVWLGDLPEGHGAGSVLAGLVEIFDQIPEGLRRTLTWDQGREMARHHELAELCAIDVFFAEPHSPWQRPTNENGNGLLRRYLPKGVNLNQYSTHDLRRIEHRLNTMPRRVLGWNTANNLYHAATVALTT